MWCYCGRAFRRSICLLLCMTVLTGLAYPLVVTILATATSPLQAGGSAVVRDGVVVGSELIGQQFAASGFFWGRPSATIPMPYNAMSSSGSNFGPANPALIKAVRQRVKALAAADPGNTAPPPVDLVTSSASGLDPDISPAAALYQVGRVAKARGVSENVVRALVKKHIEDRQFGLLGEPRVNVLALNLALDAATPKADAASSTTP